MMYKHGQLNFKNCDGLGPIRIVTKSSFIIGLHVKCLESVSVSCKVEDMIHDSNE